MRVVNFQRDTLMGIANTLGIDTTSIDLQKTHTLAWVNAINSRVRYAWEFFDFPELFVTEERAFRTVWNEALEFSRTGNEGLPDELYYLPEDKYYAVLADAPSDPPAGTLPTDETYFEELSAPPKFIAYEQIGQPYIGQVQAVYASDPGVTNYPMVGLDFYPTERGIEVGFGGANTAWIRYKLRPSQFTVDEWQADTDYEQGDIVFDLDSGNCFIATQDNQQAVTESAYWCDVPMPYVISEYVKYAAASDMADDVVLAGKLMNQAETYLTREVDKLIEQGMKLYYGNGPRARRLPLGTSGFVWSIYPPYAAP